MGPEPPDFVHDEDTPLSKKYTYPGTWWGQGDDMTERDYEFLAIESFADADVVAITDNDADGLGSAAIIKSAFPDQTVAHIESGHNNSGLSIGSALDTTAKHCPGDIEVFITDICLDELTDAEGETDSYAEDGESTFDELLFHLEQIAEKCTVHVYDHHEWSDEAAEAVDSAVDELVIAEGDLCASDITFQELEDRLTEHNPDAVERMRRLAAVTRDHDLYIKDDPQSDSLSDFAFMADTDTYVDTVRQYGPDIMEDADVSAEIQAEQEEKERRIELGVKNAEWHEIEGRTVAFAYGDFYHSEVGRRLVTGEGQAEDEADIAAIFMVWDKVSFRSDESHPYCHVLAQQFGGGGHSTAASGDTGVPGAGGYMGYEDYWDEDAETAKQVVYETLRVAFQKIDNGEIEVDSPNEDEGSEDAELSSADDTDSEPLDAD